MNSGLLPTSSPGSTSMGSMITVSRLACRSHRTAVSTFFLIALLSGLIVAPRSIRGQTAVQASPYQRTYAQSKSAVEKALKELQPSMRGRLPTLEGFASPTDHPLSRYQRGYYESVTQVTSTPSGESVVRVSTKVTAWYEDATASRSGYQLLTSNGRLESDLLDQLTDLLASSSGAARSPATSGKASAGTAPTAGTVEPAISAPVPQLPGNGHTFSSSLEHGLSSQLADAKNSPTKTSAETASLQAEAASLEEVLKNQAHPRNLVAIKKTGTAVVDSPSLSGKTLFLADAHDEFEMLDFNSDWVHVRISGLSRGWIWRTSLEMPEGISDVPINAAGGKQIVAELFQVTREETGPFPGDWEPLRGKNVKIISVQKIQEDEKNSGAQAKLEYAKSLLDKDYAELAAQSKDVAGVVLIFDSVDGGMIATTLPTIQQWKAGKLTDAALWHHCYFDPPETFTVSSVAAGH